MKTRVALSLLGLLAFTGCAVPSAPAALYVVASLEPTRGHTASGTVWFERDGSQVIVRGEVRGLAPNGEHGFHVHDKGDCSSGDGMSAGGHFNPTSQPHGPQGSPHHAGDLPSIVADASGVARFSVRTSGAVLTGGRDDLAGKGLVVHAKPDDYTTQPTGNSGDRIACGVISTVAGRDASGRER
ncbi:MAG: superoxide dismutase family protein [Caldimonas sp.]